MAATNLCFMQDWFRIHSYFSDQITDFIYAEVVQQAFNSEI